MGYEECKHTLQLSNPFEGNKSFADKIKARLASAEKRKKAIEEEIETASKLLALLDNNKDLAGLLDRLERI